jgi:hypothetical protein
MMKQLLTSTGHIPAAVAATGAAMVTHSAGVGLATYLAGRAFGAAYDAHKEEKAEGKHRALNTKQFK